MPTLDASDQLPGLAGRRVLRATTQTRSLQCLTMAAAAATAVATAPVPTPPQSPVHTTAKQLSLRTKSRRHSRRHRNSGIHTDAHRAASPYPLACPFYKHNPQRYHACAGAADIRNAHSVREHVLTEHLAPIYCPICCSHFPSALARDKHIRARSCTQRELTAEVIEGATDDQVEELLQWDDAPRRSRRGKMRGDDDEVSWFRIWDVLFPGAKRPKTARMRPSKGGKLVNGAILGEGLGQE